MIDDKEKNLNDKWLSLAEYKKAKKLLDEQEEKVIKEIDLNNEFPNIMNLVNVFFQYEKSFKSMMLLPSRSVGKTYLTNKLNNKDEKE